MTMRMLAGVAGLALMGPSAWAQATVELKPAAMAKVGTVDERFQSYNIEMVEVTGGRFWKPYDSVAKAAPAQGNQPGGNAPGGMNPDLYEYRPPIDLSNARLRKLAAALGPAYLRVSGTWANTTYFDPEAKGADTKPPEGFKGVLTGAEWRGVVGFARAADAELVTSFAMSAGTRDVAGVWTPAEAEKLAQFTKAAGGRIAAAEFMNEPTFAMMGGAPKGYDAAAYARDLTVFRGFQKKSLPGMLLLGPGGVGEGSKLAPAGMTLLSSASLFDATGPVFDVVSYHSYAAVSSRCAPPGSGGGATVEAALSTDWLARPLAIEQFYETLRDKYEPGKALWNTETAEAACGGDKWASSFVDSFRYLAQLGELARAGVQVNMYNTLAASDYGLLDEHTYVPRPNYWAALLWHRLMGRTVLNPGSGARSETELGLHVFAHCLRGHAGGVAVLAMNTSDSTEVVTAPMKGVRYALTSTELTSRAVALNGTVLALGDGDALPPLKGEAVKAGAVTLAPRSINFLTYPDAGNSDCR